MNLFLSRKYIFKNSKLFLVHEDLDQKKICMVRKTTNLNKKKISKI